LKKRETWPEYPVNKRTGWMQAYYGYDWETREVAASPFTAMMEFTRFERGRSSAIAIFTDASGAEWPMFLTHLAEVLPRLKNGTLKASWVIAKRGTNYGIALEFYE
jgi:hypothetical protein